MVELRTLGGTVKSTYEGEPNTNAFSDMEKDRVDNLAPVAMSGAYVDLTGKPTIPTGAYADLTGKPDLNFVPLTQKGANSGVAPLDAAGLVPLQHLNVSGLSFKGAWNPVTNSPQLIDGAGSVGDFYKASVAGSRNTGNGSFTYAVGDWVIFAGGTWQRLGSTDAVASVNGKLGMVTLTAADVGALPTSYAPTWNQVTSKPALVTSVNGSTGDVTVDGATWDTLPGKPTTFPSDRRGTIGPAIPAAIGRLTSNRAIGNASYTAVIWHDTLYDQFNIWNGTTGFVMPEWARFVRISGNIRFGSNSAGDRQVGIRKNGLDTTGAAWSIGPPGGTQAVSRILTSAVIPVVGGDVFTMWAYQTTGGNLNLEAGAQSQHTWVSVELFE